MIQESIYEWSIPKPNMNDSEEELFGKKLAWNVFQIADRMGLVTKKERDNIAYE